MFPTSFRFFVTFVDDYSQTTWLYLMKNRSKLYSHFRAFCLEIHTQFHVSVQSLRSNNAKKYMSEQFQSFMLQNGILHQTSCVDTPSQNRVAKRKNRHLETAQALLFQMHVPKHFLVDVVSSACFLINRMPSSVLNWNTPFQTLFPHKSLFPIEPQVFGCTCFIRDVHLDVSKFHPRSLKCIFLGYSRVQKGYKCYFLSLRRCLACADVTFLENAPFSQSPIHTNQGEDDNLLVYTLASPAPAPVPPSTKPPITQVYTLHQHPPTLEPFDSYFDIRSTHSDDLSIALRKGKRQCAHPISSFCSYNHLSSHSCSFIASLNSISLPNKVSKALTYPG